MSTVNCQTQGRTMIDKKVAKEPRISPTGPRNWVTDLLRHRSVQLAIALWAGAVVAVFLIAHGSLPFSRPSLTGDPVVGPLLLLHAGLLEELGLIALTVFLTRKRRIPDMASRPPAPRVAAREVLGMVAYAVGAHALGYARGRALGYYPISLHLPEIYRGLTPSAVFWWAGYNFVAYACLPY